MQSINSRNRYASHQLGSINLVGAVAGYHSQVSSRCVCVYVRVCVYVCLYAYVCVCVCDCVCVRLPRVYFHGYLKRGVCACGGPAGCLEWSALINVTAFHFSVEFAL